MSPETSQTTQTAIVGFDARFARRCNGTVGAILLSCEELFVHTALAFPLVPVDPSFADFSNELRLVMCEYTDSFGAPLPGFTLLDCTIGLRPTTPTEEAAWELVAPRVAVLQTANHPTDRLATRDFTADLSAITATRLFTLRTLPEVANSTVKPSSSPAFNAIFQSIVTDLVEFFHLNVIKPYLIANGGDPDAIQAVIVDSSTLPGTHPSEGTHNVH